MEKQLRVEIISKGERKVTNYKAENGRTYTLYFEKDKLIGVRYEFILRNRKYKEISGADVMKERTIYGDPTNVLFLVFFTFY